MLAVEHLRCEYKHNPLGIDARQPRLSWQIVSDGRDVMQSAYQVLVEDAGGVLWDSGRVESDQSVHVRYGGPPLHSRQRCQWRVRVWDETGETSGWSHGDWWEMGLLEEADWQVQWVDPEGDIDPDVVQPCPYLRGTFDLPDELVERARLYATARGCYEVYINGQRVGDQVLTPGWTSYHDRLQVQAYDVTGLLQSGANAVGATLGDGWWRGKVGVESVRNTYGQRLALLAQLHITFQDGSEVVVGTGPDWKRTTGPILKSDLKDGEVYDARLEMPGWNTIDFDDSDWHNVRGVDHGFENLVAESGPPIRKKEEFVPVAILKTPAGQTVVDMGQNFAGFVRLKVEGPAGTVVSLQHGEALNQDGNFSLKHLQLPQPGADKLLQKVEYTLKGDGVEIYEPHFTFHGFRYVCVEGFPGELTLENLTGIAVYSDMPSTGVFECSNSMVNRLQRNIVWSQKSNFLDVPTDCPQRERAGWTGDAQVFVRTSSFNMETAGFFAKWLKDLAAGQRSDGVVPNLIPDPYWDPDRGGSMITWTEGSAGWGDAAVIVPWSLYWSYGDRVILEEQYDSMKAWVENVRTRASRTHWVRQISPAYWFSREKRERQAYIWDTGYHWGEWLEPDNSWAAITLGLFKRMVFSEPVVATAYFSYSSRLLAEIAEVLGKADDAEAYRALSEKVAAAYAAQFVGKDGRIKPDRQASYVRVLALDLVPEEMRPTITRRLVEKIREADTHIGTGFLSTPFLCHVLTAEGQLDLAYELLNQDTIPSWLYPITKGATTIWESWDGIKPDGSVMASLNHYSPGSIGSWLYQVVAGIEIGAPGYKQIQIEPQPGGGLSHASATYHSIYGQIESRWRIEGGRLILNVEIPPNTRATVRLPRAEGRDVTESGQPLETQPEGPDAIAEVGSGRYEFIYGWDVA